MSQLIDRYLDKEAEYRVLELGSGISPGQQRTHRELLDGYHHSYVGVDVRAGENVDIVMTRPYSIPVPSNSADLVLTGAVFEHVPYFWASMLELARILRPGGLLFVSVPSRGHKHTQIDCWRFYPDGMRAMAASARLELLEAHTHFPPLSGKRHDYARIDVEQHYWGDTVGVFAKPDRYPLQMLLVRPVVRWWANRSDLGARPPAKGCEF